MKDGGELHMVDSRYGLIGSLIALLRSWHEVAALVLGGLCLCQFIARRITLKPR